MKTLGVPLLIVSVFVASAFAIDTQFKTRVITSATLTIHVKNGLYLTIRNFTQDTDTGQRGFVFAGIIPPTPTPPPTPAPTPTPTLSTNAGPGVALSTGDKLTDTATLFGDINPTGTIIFTLKDPTQVIVDTETITVNGNASYSTPNGFTPTVTGTYLWSAHYSGDGTNSQADDNGQNETEIVTATPTPAPTPVPTPTPIFGTVITATIVGASPVEFIKPIIIAGPATLTIDPVPGATLSITYRKELQPIQPTPTPTATSSTTISTLTPSTTTTSTVGVSSTSLLSMPTTTLSDDDDTYSSLPTSAPTSTPKTTPSVTPAQTPTPTPTLTPTPTI
jgi:hypothetical protein